MAQARNRSGMQSPCSEQRCPRLDVRDQGAAPAGDFAVCLGGAETYGRFISVPFPQLLARQLDTSVVNLGSIGAGLDAVIKDAGVMALCQRARVVVMQVFGAHMMSNRFYRVHPRRNDRVVQISDALKLLYPDVDFTRYAFINHLLDDLQRLDPARFEVIRVEMAQAWCARMRSLVAAIGQPVILFWFAPFAPGTNSDAQRSGPKFVTPEMLADVASAMTARVTLCAPFEGTEGMDFTPAEAEIAQAMMGVQAHHAAAQALLRPVTQILGGDAKRARHA